MIYDTSDPVYHSFLKNGGQSAAGGGGGGGGGGSNQVKVAGAGGKAKVQATSA